MCGRGRAGVPDSGWGPVGGVTVGKPVWTGGHDSATGDLRGESQGVLGPTGRAEGLGEDAGWDASLAPRLKALNGASSTRCPREQPEPLRFLGCRAAARAPPGCAPRPGFQEMDRGCWAAWISTASNSCRPRFNPAVSPDLTERDVWGRGRRSCSVLRGTRRPSPRVVANVLP